MSMASLGLPARTNSSSASLNLPASHETRLTEDAWSQLYCSRRQAERCAAVPGALHAYRDVRVC